MRSAAKPRKRNRERDGGRCAVVTYSQAAQRHIEGLRRRREASRRLEPLADGRRDPLDLPRPRRLVQVRAIGKNTVEFLGSDAAVYAAIRALDVRYQRAPRGGAWQVPQAAADDVMALLEHRGNRLEVVL